MHDNNAAQKKKNRSLIQSNLKLFISASLSQALEEFTPPNTSQKFTYSKVYWRTNTSQKNIYFLLLKTKQTVGGGAISIHCCNKCGNSGLRNPIAWKSHIEATQFAKFCH